MSQKSPIPSLRFQWNKVFVNEAQRRMKIFTNLIPKLRSRKGLLYLKVQEYVELIETLRDQVVETREEAAFTPSVSDYMPDISHQTSTKPAIVAGVEIDQIEAVDVAVAEFSLFGTPPMVDRAVDVAKRLIELEERLKQDQYTLDILEEEFEEVSRQLAVFEEKFVPWLEEAVRKVKQRISDNEALGAGIAGKVKKRHAETDESSAA
jgi:V/A-type H+-transporting ATPase subunit D